MKLLFLGKSLGAEPTSALQKLGLEIQGQSSAREAEAPLIVALPVSVTTELDEVREIRSRYPHSWLAALLPKNFETDSRLTDRLADLGAVGVNELWTEDTWVRRLPFSMACAKHFAVHSMATEMLMSTQDAVARLEKNVALASAIHRQLLPITFPSFPGIQLSAKFIPASSGNGGNYFDVFELGDGKRLGILLADSQTHGMAASLLGALIKFGAEEIRTRFPDPVEFAKHLVAQATEKSGKPENLQLLYAVFDRTDLSLNIAVHGRIGLTRWREGKVETLLPNEANPGVQLLQEQLQPKDWLVFLTDGWFPVLDAQPRSLPKILESFPKPDAVVLQQELSGIVDRWRDQDETPEDLTCVQLHIDARALFVAK